MKIINYKFYKYPNGPGYVAITFQADNKKETILSFTSADLALVICELDNILEEMAFSSFEDMK